MSRLKIEQTLLLIVMMILSACGQSQNTIAQVPSVTRLAQPFTVYANGSPLHLNLPLNLSAQAVWTMSPTVGQLTGQGRHGVYISPSNVTAKTTVHLLFTDANHPNKAYALDLNLVPTGLAAQATTVGPAGMTLCASEGGQCSFTGLQAVAYGADGIYTYKLVNGGVDCNNLIFGDPMYNTVKSCFVGDASLMNVGGPTGYTYCANEGDQCAFIGSDNVAYGAKDSFVIHTKVDGAACTNAIFGDPLPGVLKNCYVKASAPAGYKFCALENQSCDFTGTQRVAYGANDQFIYLNQTDGTSCNNLVFGDPVPGSVKGCYLAITDQGGPIDPTDDLIAASDITATIAPTVTPPTTFAGSEVGFSGMGSVGNTLKYNWDFGDGTSAAGDPEASGDTVHTYGTPGYYTARLTVTDTPTSTVKTAEYRIAILPDVNDLPSSRVVNVNGSLTFDVKYPMPNLAYEWTFSDGTVLQGPAVTKTVGQGGFTTYTLRVYDGTLDENGQRHVTAQDEARYNAALPPLDGTVLSAIGSGANVSAFRAYFPFSNDGTNVQVVSYDWDFGDGQRLTTTTPYVEHHYGRTGAYAVTLVATDNYGRQATVHHALVRQNSLGINFHLQACLNELVGACQWPKAPVSPSPCPSGLGQTPLIRCQGALTPQGVPMTAQSQTGFSANLPNLLPTAGTQVLARFYPVNSSPAIETTFSQLTSGENVLSVDGNTASVYAFDGLRVPDYVVNILPDEQFDFMAPPPEPLQYRDRLGVVRLLQIVNIPERQVSADDRINFSLPIYAIDTSGALLTSLSGNLYAHFKGDGGLSASSVELVNGVGQMQIHASVTDIQAGKVTPGNVEVLSPSCYNEVVTPDFTDFDSCKSKPGVNESLPNYYCSVYYAGEYDSYYTYGCASLVASSEVPTGLTSATPVVQLFANVTSPQSIGLSTQGFTFNLGVFNRINLGSTSALRKKLDDYLKKFEGSSVQFVVGFVPLVGSGSDLLIQAYTYGTTGRADPVIVTFGVVGIAFDVAGVFDFETTLPAAETVKGLVGVYKIGGPFTKEAIKGLTVVLKGEVTPAEAYALLKGSASFMADAAKAGVNPVQLRDSLEEGIKLATERTGNAFNGLKLFSKSYSDLRAVGAFASQNLSFLNKMKIAKYSIVAPEIAKAMAKCGSKCIIQSDDLVG